MTYAPSGCAKIGGSVVVAKESGPRAGPIQESVRANLYAAGIELADAELTSEGDQWKYESAHPIARNWLNYHVDRSWPFSVMESKCSPPLTPIKTLKPVEPNIRKPSPKPLQVSYGVEP